MGKSEQEWAVAKVFERVEEARFAAGFLQSNGIAAEIESLHVDELPVNVGSLAEVRLRVPADRLAEARALLSQQEAATGTDLDEAALGAGSSEGETNEQ
jgi:hypothetical protein